MTDSKIYQEKITYYEIILSLFKKVGEIYGVNYEGINIHEAINKDLFSKINKAEITPQDVDIVSALYLSNIITKLTEVLPQSNGALLEYVKELKASFDEINTETEDKIRLIETDVKERDVIINNIKKESKDYTNEKIKDISDRINKVIDSFNLFKTDTDLKEKIGTIESKQSSTTDLIKDLSYVIDDIKKDLEGVRIEIKKNPKSGLIVKGGGSSGAGFGTQTNILFKSNGTALGSGGTVSEINFTGNVNVTRTNNSLEVNIPDELTDILEYVNLAGFPETGESGKIYIAKDTNKTYRWSGSAYVEVGGGGGGGTWGSITGTLSSQTDLQSSLDAKANTSHTHTKSQITDFAHNHIVGDVTGLQSSLDGKASLSHTHAISDIINLQTSLDGKANTSHTHTKSQITDFAHNHTKADITDFAHTHTKADITDFAHTHTIGDVTGLQTALDSKQATLGFTPENVANKGVANGYASLDTNAKIPTSQLPSYVDDVLEYTDLASLPVTGENGKIYITLDTNKTYRWSGSAYVEISSSLALGTTSSTAFQGDLGQIAYTHTSRTDNPHSVTKAQVGLANVDNTSDANKPVSTATQTALNAKQATLVSGTNIKTINGTSVLGSGDIIVGGSISVTDGTTTVNPTTDIVFTGLSVTDNGSGEAEVSLDGDAISDLTALTSADPTDVLPIVDVSVNETKKITYANLINGLALDKAVRKSVTTSASSLTPDFNTAEYFEYTALAADITINAPTNMAVGDVLRILIIASGANRTPTFNASYKFADGNSAPTSIDTGYEYEFIIEKSTSYYLTTWTRYAI